MESFLDHESAIPGIDTVLQTDRGPLRKLSSLIDATVNLYSKPASNYRYEPLKNENSIRLLVLQPAHSPDDSLQCHLQEVPLSDRLRYEAISYA